MSNERSVDRLLSAVDFMHLPIGVYVLALDGQFSDCNDGVRGILGLASTGPIDANIRDFYVEPGQFEELTEAALAAERNGGFEKSVVHFVVDGRDVYAEDYLKPIRDGGDEVLGYIGCMAEITEEHQAAQRSGALQEKVEELTFDIGQIFHANTSLLIMVSQTLSAVANALSQSLQTASGSGAKSASPLSADDAEAAISHKARELARAVERLVESADVTRRLEALPEPRWKLLEEQIEPLANHEKLITVPEMRSPTLRACAVAIVEIVQQIKPGLLAREKIRDVNRFALELQSLTCLRDVASTRTTVVQMDYTLRALRDFITTEVRAHEPRKSRSVERLVQEAIKQLAEFSKASNVNIVWRERSTDLRVHCDEREVVRALANLLHNAIKYSWRRDRDKSPWVAIKVGQKDEMAVIEFETWGVPITNKEISEGLIYQMGYRGKWSTDRGRLGTGIGLTDSLRVARNHGGTMAVSSTPAHPTALGPDDREYYQRPFLTRVLLKLPIEGGG